MVEATEMMPLELCFIASVACVAGRELAAVIIDLCFFREIR